MAGLKRALTALWLLLSLVGAEAWADAPAMLLAEPYAGGIDVSRYWVSEKYDGVRAQWDGRELRFRAGGRIPAPAWFTVRFPAVPLDGELWIARGQFDLLSGIVRRLEPMDAEWRQVRYMVFELPEAPGDFSARLEQMNGLIAGAGVPWLIAIEQTRMASHAALMQRLDRMVRDSGEGLMLHRADAPYQTGRSDALLKLKPWQDAEAVVVGHTPGKGKYLGLTGALQMEMTDGKRFNLGSGLTDALRRNPPALGTRITYRYQHLTPQGLPRFPRYLRERVDF